MKNILIVEDDSFLAHAYTAKLSKSGFNMKLAKDGVEAMEILDAGEFKPELILLDLVMPRMDGFDVLNKLKENGKIDTIPVVVASNLGQEEDIKKAMDLGAKDFIVKSNFSLQELIGKIEKLSV